MTRSLFVVASTVLCLFACGSSTEALAAWTGPATDAAFGMKAGDKPFLASDQRVRIW